MPPDPDPSARFSKPSDESTSASCDPMSDEEIAQLVLMRQHREQTGSDYALISCDQFDRLFFAHGIQMRFLNKAHPRLRNAPITI